MSHHFACTACGKCCFGWIPLTIADAVKHAANFPIAVIWTPIKRSDPSFALTERLFTSFRPEKGPRIALRVVPTAYIPPQMACPQLQPDGLCAIHASKPQRCRTMPFFPLREERRQDGMLAPRPGWNCDVSETAPVVFDNGRILDRTDFDAELSAIRAESATIAKYAKAILGSSGQMAAILARTAEISGGNVVLGFATLLQTLADVDAVNFASRQVPVLRHFAEHTQGDAQLATYHGRYAAWADELAVLGKA
jgi:Fe-S-cluster containining protein